MSDEKFRNGGGIILGEGEENVSEACKVSEIFNDFFISVASEIGCDENIVSVTDAINECNNHLSVEKIKQHFKKVIRDFVCQTHVDADRLMLMIKNLD